MSAATTPQAFASELRDARFLADVGECAVAVVVEQPAGHGVVDTRDAVLALAVLVRLPQNLFFDLAEIHEPADEQVEAAVVVVVEPDGAGGPAGSGDAGFLGHVGERAVAVVVIEDAAAVLRDVEVGEAVAVVVADRDAHAVAAAGDAGLFGHVGECAVAIVAIERVAQRAGGVVRSRTGRC